MSWLRRVIPAPVKRLLKAFRLDHSVAARALTRRDDDRFHSRLVQSRQTDHAADASVSQPAQAAPRRPSGPDATSGDAADELASLRALRLQAATERDQALEELRAARASISELERALRFPAEAWWEQRAGLVRTSSASALRDLAFFPGGRDPHISMLHSRLPESGFDARPIVELDHLHRLPTTSLLHLHATSATSDGATTESQAREKADRFVDPIAAFVERGGTLLWSLAEAIPADCRFPEVEVALRRDLAGLAAAIHLPHDSIAAEAAPLYPLDEDKRFVVRHPLPIGYYPDFVPRDSARRLLGLDAAEVLLLTLAASTSDADVERTVHALPRLQKQADRPIRLAVVRPTDAVDDALSELIEATAGASLVDAAVDHQYVHVLLRAADLLVQPADQPVDLTALLLGLGFGVQIVAPTHPITRDLAESGLVRLFDPASDEDFQRSVGAVIESSEADTAQLPRSFLDQYDLSAIAAEFAGHVRRVAPAR